jgi:hypothetical protein
MMADFRTTPGDPAASPTQPTTGGAYAGGNSTGGIVDKVRESAAAQLTTQKDRAFDGLGSVAQAVRSSTQQLRDQQHETLAGYVEQAADHIDRFAKQLRNKDVTELLDDAQRLARRQPAVFVGSAFAVGLIGARFLKSSTHHDADQPGDRSGMYDQGSLGRGAYNEGRLGGDRYGQYGGGTTRGTEWPTSQSGVSPAGGSTPQASGSSYATSEPYRTPSSSGTGTGGANTGTSSANASGTTRSRTGARPESGGTTSGRTKRSGSDTERS